MCRPSKFSIEYSINPWMTGEEIDIKLAMSQWELLKSKIEKHGCKVEEIDQAEGLPDMVFTANGGVVRGDKAIISNFMYREREGEHREYKRWFKDHKYKVIELGEDKKFEGRGDCFIWGKYLIGGYGYRSHRESLVEVSEELGLELIALRLTDERFYHLDTCMSVFESGEGLYYPGAFKADEIKKLPFKLRAISEEDACNFSCNNIEIGKAIIMTKPSSQIRGELGEMGYVIEEVEMSEFIKAGGSARCLVLKI